MSIICHIGMLFELLLYCVHQCVSSCLNLKKINVETWMSNEEHGYKQEHQEHWIETD